MTALPAKRQTQNRDAVRSGSAANVIARGHSENQIWCANVGKYMVLGSVHPGFLLSPPAPRNSARLLPQKPSFFARKRHGETCNRDQKRCQETTATAS